MLVFWVNSSTAGNTLTPEKLNSLKINSNIQSRHLFPSWNGEIGVYRMEGWKTLKHICSLAMDVNEVFMPHSVWLYCSGGSKAFSSLFPWVSLPVFILFASILVCIWPKQQQERPNSMQTVHTPRRRVSECSKQLCVWEYKVNKNLQYLIP